MILYFCLIRKNDWVTIKLSIDSVFIQVSSFSIFIIFVGMVSIPIGFLAFSLKINCQILTSFQNRMWNSTFYF